MPVIGSAAAIQFAVLYDGCPGVEIIVPAAKFRLLVVMAIEQYDFVRITRYVDEQYRRSSLDTTDFNRYVLYRLRSAPGFQHLYGPIHMAVLLPVGIEVRRLVGYFYVFRNLRNDLVIPHVANKIGGFLVVHCFAVRGW